MIVLKRENSVIPQEEADPSADASRSEERGEIPLVDWQWWNEQQSYLNYINQAIISNATAAVTAVTTGSCFHVKVQMQTHDVPEFRPINFTMPIPFGVHEASAGEQAQRLSSAHSWSEPMHGNTRQHEARYH